MPAMVVALLCLEGLSASAIAQPLPTTRNYISPTARGIRPRYHKPILPAPVLSMHGLSSFPIGASGNLAEPIQAGPGFRLSGSWQSSNKMAVELSYRASTHETTGDHNGRGFFQSMHLGAILFPLDNPKKFQPFFSVATHALGFFSERLTANKMMGFGIDFSGGVRVLISRKTSVNVGLRYMGTFINTADSSFFGARANSATFLNQLSPEMGLVFFL